MGRRQFDGATGQANQPAVVTEVNDAVTGVLGPTVNPENAHSSESSTRRKRFCLLLMPNSAPIPAASKGPFEATLRFLLLIEQIRTVELLALENDDRNTFDRGDVLERIPIHQQQIGVVAHAN